MDRRSGRSGGGSTGTGGSGGTPVGTGYSRGSRTSDRSGSRVPSRNKGGSGGIFFNPLASKGSRSFLGSKSSLSSSRRNLASESLRALAAQATLLDEEGFDVTPVSLLDQEHSVVKKNQLVFFKPDKENPTPNASLFQSSIYGMPVGGPAASVIHVPFSSMTDMGASSLSISMTEEFRNLPEARPEVPEPVQLEASESFEAPKELTEQDLEKEVEIMLSETETLCMLDIQGTYVYPYSEEEDLVKESNEQYEKLLQSHSGNDNYTERHVQTINDAPKFKLVQTDTVKSKDVGVIVSTWDMYSTYEALKCEEEAHEEETLEELSSRAASRMTDASGTRAPTSLGGEIGTRDNDVNSTKIPGESSIAVSMIESSGSFDNPNVVRRPKSEEVTYDPSVPNSHPILKMESLMDRFRTMERAITQNNYHPKQALYRNVDPIEDPDYPSSGVNITINTPHLDKLWSYSCPLTKRRKVTCMAWNNSNQDIIAVGYGTFKAEDDCTGLICCWSLKNPQFPERIFHAPSGITSVSFSHKNPNLLAAGLFNGTIVLYNARSDSHESVLDSRDALHKHSGPVWKVNWIMKEHSLGESRSENLISISTDGHVLQWSIRKGFESTQLMNLKRQISNKQASKKAKSKPSVSPAPGHSTKHGAPPKAHIGPGGGEAYISHHAPGMGFDFWPRDPNIYLACTDEGFIHKCSCSYNEQVLETYNGHAGPVYHVSWSPFVSDYFLSCSADWSVKLWVQNKTAPLQSFSAAQKSVNDVCWSPFCSTMFGCVSEGRVEIWNLEYSGLDPIIVHRPLSSATLTSITFAKNSRVVLVGDTGGEVSVYLLSNLQALPSNQEDALLTAVNSMSKREHIVTP